MLTIQEILRGCEVGRIQTVGTMQVIPLTLNPELQDDRFASPEVVRVSTTNYGTLSFTNTSGKDVLLPANSAYMVKQAAQDHAMSVAGIVPSKQRATWDNAMCIQETQGGLISQGEHQMAILPLALRKPALGNRGRRQYNTLWGPIRQLCTESGLGHRAGNLVEFVDGFSRQLDQFIAEFEIVDNQVGAIVLINGEVVGFERAPSAAYWCSIWEPLVRVCYGSAAIVASRKAHSVDEVLKTRVPIKVTSLASLQDVARELGRAERKQDDLAKRQVRHLLDEPFSEERSQRHASTDILTVKNSQFYGQVCQDRHSSKILYTSLVIQDGWDESAREWRLAEKFTI